MERSIAIRQERKGNGAWDSGLGTRNAELGTGACRLSAKKLRNFSNVKSWPRNLEGAILCLTKEVA